MICILSRKLWPPPIESQKVCPLISLVDFRGSSSLIDVIYHLMAALMLMSMIVIMAVLMGMLLALVLVGMLMLIICVATHSTSPPSLDNIR
jgi:hypothetical protein